MMKFNGLILLILILGIVSPLLATYQVGDLVSNFTLNDHQGDPVSLYDYPDAVIVLDFWEVG